MPNLSARINRVLRESKKQLDVSPGLLGAIESFFLIDVKEYLSLLEELDGLTMQKQCQEEELRKKIAVASDNVIEKGEKLKEKIGSKIIVKKIKGGFRDLVGEFVYRSIIMERAYKKPRGYPGDFGTLEYLYDNKPVSKGIGRLFDQYFLSNKLAQAVVNRKDLMVSILGDLIGKAKSQKVNVLNVASGSCRDVREFLEVYKGATPLLFTCLDHDEESLGFSKEALEVFQNIKFDFIKDDVIKFAEKVTSQGFAKQNIIYSIGLADYIPDRLLKKIVSSFFALLKPGGSLVIAHKDKCKFSTLPPDWFCDWKFVARDEPDLVGLVKESGIEGFALKTLREDAGVIFFLIIEKNG